MCTENDDSFWLVIIITHVRSQYPVCTHRIDYILHVAISFERHWSQFQELLFLTVISVVHSAVSIVINIINSNKKIYYITQNDLRWMTWIDRITWALLLRMNQRLIAIGIGRDREREIEKKFSKWNKLWKQFIMQKSYYIGWMYVRACVELVLQTKTVQMNTFINIFGNLEMKCEYIAYHLLTSWINISFWSKMQYCRIKFIWIRKHIGMNIYRVQFLFGLISSLSNRKFIWTNKLRQPNHHPHQSFILHFTRFHHFHEFKFSHSNFASHTNQMIKFETACTHSPYRCLLLNIDRICNITGNFKNLFFLFKNIEEREWKIYSDLEFVQNVRIKDQTK